MAQNDYGTVEAIENPDFSNVRIIRKKGRAVNQYTDIKYIDNQYINTPNSAYKGFSKVGKWNENGKWNILEIWAVW